MIRKKQERTELIIIDLTGPEGNAFVLLGYAKQWAKQLGLDWDKIRAEATASDYEWLLHILDAYFGDYVIFER